MSLRIIAEHVWEKYFVTTFLNWLTFDPPDPDVPPPKNKKSKKTSKSKVSKGTTGAPTDAETFKSIFKTKGTKLPFSKQIPATVIANAISTTKRVDEFMLLEAKINTAKTVVGPSLGKSELYQLLMIPRYFPG
jgi:hypothetical protein